MAEYEVIVNGRKQIVSEEVTFDQAVVLALGPRGNRAATVTYGLAHDEPDEGSLVEGESVRVTNGTVFNVTYRKAGAP